MRAGKLRHYVNVEHKVTTGPTDTRGHTVAEWQTLYADVPAEVVTLSGREVELARQITASADHRITIRYHSGITEEMRFALGDRVFNIVWINNVDQRNRTLETLCTEEK